MRWVGRVAYVERLETNAEFESSNWKDHLGVIWIDGEDNRKFRLERYLVRYVRRLEACVKLEFS
jgi:hypothetical protein